MPIINHKYIKDNNNLWKCSSCKKDIYKWNSGEMYPGKQILTSDFVSNIEGVPNPTPGTEMRCPLCRGWLEGVPHFESEKS